MEHIKRTSTRPANRFDASELAGAFGDLGTLIPFVVGYIAVLKLHPTGVLLAFGVAMIVVGLVYRTPFPVQPMKAIGAAAIAQSGHIAALSASAVVAAGLITGIVWLILSVTGLAHHIAKLLPRSALIGVILGLGLSFMLEGIRMMGESPWAGAVLLMGTLLLLRHPKLPAMLVLLVVGAAIAFVERPALLNEFSGITFSLNLPAFAWPTLTWQDLWVGLLLLALPQLPLTFGNALTAITEENNRLFPDRPVTERKVALSTGLMNVCSSAIGGVPMCHGAGGMAGHVQFGARTGGASIMLGVLLVALGLFFASSVEILFKLFPAAVLGVILFLAGAQLALGARDPSSEKVDRFIVLATAAFSIWNVGIAVAFGVVTYHAWKRGWLHL